MQTYHEKLICIHKRLAKYNYSNNRKPKREFQTKFIDIFQEWDNPEKYYHEMKKYGHPDEKYIEGLIQTAVNYFGLSQFVAERTKSIFASMWSDQKTLLQNINEEDAVLGIMLNVVYKYFRTGTTIDVIQFVKDMWGNEFERHLTQVYLVHNFVCSLYFNEIDLQTEEEDTAYLHELSQKKMIYFDGSCQNGIMAIGVVLLDGYYTVDKISKIKGSGTNNQAEYLAAIEGMKKALSLNWKSVTIQNDSQLVINQLNEEWAVTSENLLELYLEAKELMEQFDFIELEWIPRKMNVMAHCQAAKAKSSLFYHLTAQK